MIFFVNIIEIFCKYLKKSSILCNRPDFHLRKVFDIYQQKHGHTIEKAISKEFSGDIKKALTNLGK